MSDTIGSATVGTSMLVAALAEADDIAHPNQRRNTDGVADLQRQLPRALAGLSPEARATLAHYLDGIVDAVATANQVALSKLPS